MLSTIKGTMKFEIYRRTCKGHLRKKMIYPEYMPDQENIYHAGMSWARGGGI